MMNTKYKMIVSKKMYRSHLGIRVRMKKMKRVALSLSKRNLKKMNNKIKNQQVPRTQSRKSQKKRLQKREMKTNQGINLVITLRDHVHTVVTYKG